MFMQQGIPSSVRKPCGVEVNIVSKRPGQARPGQYTRKQCILALGSPLNLSRPPSKMSSLHLSHMLIKGVVNFTLKASDVV